MKPKFDHKVIRPQPWVPAASTNIARTFARIRREQEQAQREQAQKVQPLKVARG